MSIKFLMLGLVYEKYLQKNFDCLVGFIVFMQNKKVSVCLWLSIFLLPKMHLDISSLLVHLLWVLISIYLSYCFIRLRGFPAVDISVHYTHKGSITRTSKDPFALQVVDLEALQSSRKKPRNIRQKANLVLKCSTLLAETLF